MKEYKRLTMRKNGLIDTNCKNCKNCKKVGRKFICEDMTACDEEIVNRLAELEDKIENGTLIELPCKVGDKIFFVEQLINSGEWVLCNDYASGEYIVTDIYLNINKEPKFRVKNLYGTLKLSDFGERAFLTKAEAKAKLKELQNER